MLIQIVGLPTVVRTTSNMISDCCLIVILLMAMFVFPGCGTKTPTPPNAVEVIGEVKLDDQSIVEANLVFIPGSLKDRQQNETPMAYGTTDENGRFELKLTDGSKQIKPGDYRVIITKRKRQSDRPTLLADLKNRFPDLVPDDAATKRFAGFLPDEVFPPRFNQNSELQVTIDADLTVNTINFDLHSVDVLLE